MTPYVKSNENLAMYHQKVRWRSGLTRQLQVLVSSEAWVRIPL